MSDSDSASEVDISRQQLRLKILKIQQWYKDYLGEVNMDSLESLEDSKHVQLLESMERWHKNSHISDVMWRSKFEEIVPMLNIQSKMKLDKILQQFLDKKVRSNKLVEQLRIPDFLDFLSASIRELYQSLLDADKDEYVFDFATMGGTETWFFVNYFQPAAFFYTYRCLHDKSSERELLNDLFTIGAGSKTDAYYPEVTVVCPLCLVEYIRKVPEGADYQVLCHSINSKVLKLQIADRFMKPMSLLSTLDASIHLQDNDSGSNDDDYDSFENPFCMYEVEHLSKEEFSGEKDNSLQNPFLFENQDNNRSVRPFECCPCQLSFSREDFLVFHKEIFHKESDKIKTAKRRLKLDFVEEGNDLITTFCNSKKQSRHDVAADTSRKTRTLKQHKRYGTRAMSSKK